MRIILALIICCSLPAISAFSQSGVRIRFSLQVPAHTLHPEIGIRGNTPPLSWDKSHPMTDADGDGIYEADILFAQNPPYNVLEYKYMHQEKWEKAGNRCLVFDAGFSTTYTVDEWEKPIVLSPSDFPQLPSGQLLQDYRLAIEAYLTLHPGLERYQSKQEIEAHFQRLEPHFQRDLDIRQAYLAFSKLAAGIRCGHTYANFYNQPAHVQQLVFEQPDKLPFCFRLPDRRMILTDNLSEDPRLTPGTEIKAINGVPVGRILDSLLTVVKADGDNDGKRLKDLEVVGLGRFEGFDIYFPLFFPPQNNVYQLEVHRPNSDLPLQCTVKAVSRSERKGMLSKRLGKNDSPIDELWQFEIRQDSIAYLQLGTFVTWQMKIDWEAFLKHAFEEISRKKIPHLVIDIRGNEGGNDEVGLELAKYLAREDVRMEPSRTMTRYTIVPDKLAPYLSSWDNSFRDISKATSPIGNGWFLVKDKKTNQFPRQKNAFQGQVYLLVDAANSSATFYLSKIIKESRLATLIGQTTGGSLQGLNGGQTAFLRLPHSGIELDIPLLGTFFDSKLSGGIEPDIMVSLTVQDIISGNDPAWKAVLEYVKK
jgi:hypothetical protein